MPEAALCLLADFPIGALVAHDDLVAGVVTRFEGPFGGTAVLALDPEDAFAWVRATEGPGDPIERYLEAAGRLVGAAVEGWGASVGATLACGTPRLHEDSVVGILLGTHAPSDTGILSVRLSLETPGGACNAYLYLLLDPKVLEVWAANTA